MPNLPAAIAFVQSCTIKSHRNYAERVFAWYRDQGTGREVNPEWAGVGLSSTTRNRIHHAIRHYMVGDCDFKGYRIDATGKRI